MKKFRLSTTAFDTLMGLDLRELWQKINIIPDLPGLETDEITLLMILLTEEISTTGMTTDQQDVNSYGRELYKLYDELHTQK